MATARLAPVSKYLVFNNQAQCAAVSALRITTVYDLFNAVWIDSEFLPRDTSRMYVLKGRLLGFLNAACLKTFIDLHALKRDKLIEFGGKYPNQFVALVVDHIIPVNRNTFVSCKATHAPITVREKLQSLMHAYESVPVPVIDDANCGLSDEDALQRALKDSLVLCKPSPPDELCCPITLELFCDPVSTIRGQTYERKAIMDWLRKSATDPITGCPLKITTVWPDKEMLSRVAAFCA